MYDFTTGAPDFKMVLQTGDPRHCCRPPRWSKKNTHVHTRLPADDAKVLLTRDNPLHNSVDTFYEVPPVPCNVAVRPADDPAIRWAYDNTSRQCARPYVERPRVAETTTVVKVARRPGKPPTAYAVHPACWEAIAAAGREVPGDVIAALCRMPAGERAREVEALRRGAVVSCYFN